jgi:hypothetical protein
MSCAIVVILNKLGEIMFIKTLTKVLVPFLAAIAMMFAVAGMNVELVGAQSSFDSTFEFETTTTQLTEEDAEGLIAAFTAFLAALFIPLLVAAVVMIVAMWKIFEKAGKPGWYALIPILNAWTLFEVSGKPGWWSLVGIAAGIPVVNFIAGPAYLVLFILATISLAEKFGKGGGFVALLILLPIVGYPMLAFGDAKYNAAPATPGAGGTMPPQPPQQPPQAPQPPQPPQQPQV